MTVSTRQSKPNGEYTTPLLITSNGEFIGDDVMTQFKEIPASKRSLEKRKSVCGIGTNDAWYRTAIMVDGEIGLCPFYRTWLSMIERCYSQKNQSRRPTYIGCSVHPDWFIFSNFREWMETKNWEGLHLDKDVLIKGNKIYGPDTCCFVSLAVNNLLLSHGSSRGEWPIGVTWWKSRKKFVAKLRVRGMNKHIGCFDTQSDAAQAYCDAKARHVANIASEHDDPRIRMGLYKHAASYVLMDK